MLQRFGHLKFGSSKDVLVKVLILPSKVTKKIAGPYKGTAQDYAPSALPTVQVKPSEQLDTGTTVSSPPPIEAPWLKKTPEQ